MISILIPIYAKTQEELTWLSSAVDSVRKQNFTDWEIIIVDDCSPVVDTIEVSDANIKVYRQDMRRGPGAARNLAARVAHGEWLLALDSDDELTIGALQEFYRYACDISVIYGDIEWFGDRAGYQRTFDYDPVHLRKLEGPLPVTALHSRKAWQFVGGWDEHLRGLEDIDYWIKLADVGICPRRIDYTTLRYRSRFDGRSRSLENNKTQMKLTVDQIREKHQSFFGGKPMAECSSCPGSGSPDMNTVDAFKVPPTPGWVELKYIGLMQGSFFTPHSQTTGNRYRVEGRGSYMFVHPDDVKWLLSFAPRGFVEFEPVQRTPVATIATMNAAFDALPILPELPSIASIKKLKKALTVIDSVTDLLDLRVMMAEENAQPHPRPEIIEAIWAQMVKVDSE